MRYRTVLSRDIKFNAVFAQLTSFKGLKNRLIWRYIQVMKDFQQRRDLEGSKVDVPYKCWTVNLDS